MGNRTHPPPRIPSRRQVSDHILQRYGFRGKGEILQRILLLYLHCSASFQGRKRRNEEEGSARRPFPSQRTLASLGARPQKRFGHTRRRKRDERQERTKREKRKHESWRQAGERRRRRRLSNARRQQARCLHQRVRRVLDDTPKACVESIISSWPSSCPSLSVPLRRKGPILELAAVELEVADVCRSPSWCSLLSLLDLIGQKARIHVVEVDVFFVVRVHPCPAVQMCIPVLPPMSVQI